MGPKLGRCFKSDKNVNFYFIEPYWNFPKEKDYEVTQGMLDYYYNCYTNINLLFKSNNL